MIRTMIRTVVYPGFVLAVCFAPACLLAQSTDQVVPLQGVPASGKITEITPTEVVVDVRGDSRKFAVNEIRRVSFAEDPPDLRRARDNVLTGQYERALARLKQIDADSIQRAEVKQDVQFYMAYVQGRQALSSGGDKSAAVTAMLRFVRQHPDSFHFFDGAELLGDLAVALGSYGNAAKYYNAIAVKAPWTEYKMKTTVLEAQALLAQEKYAEAQGRFEDVIARDVDTAQATRQKRLAEVGKAICDAESGAPEEAIGALEQIIEKNDSSDTELFGRTYNALGRAQLAAGQEQEALLAYLHVDVLFYAEPEVHAEALYHLTKLWPAVDKSDRAAEARSLLTERYAGSRWAKKE